MTIDPEELLRSALEKIVFFECRVSQLESELAAGHAIAERARADAAQARRREVELERELATEKGARGDADTRAAELAERVRLLEGERERLLDGLVARARLGGAPGADGAPGPEEGGADLAGFIAELRAEIEVLRGWKRAAEAAGVRIGGAAAPGAPVVRRESPEKVAEIAGRFEEEGRVGLTRGDAGVMRDLLATHSDRALYERSMEQLAAADASTRLRAVRALEALGSKAAAPLLASALGRETDPEVKAALLSALARFKEPFAAELAARELEDRRPAVRVAALEALAATAEDAAEARLASALADPSPLVRRRAALLLGFARGSGAEEALAGALADVDRGVVRAAVVALSGRPTARAQGALTRALEHADPAVRRAAAGALARFADVPIDADAPAHARRSASRRIAERLAALGGDGIREAVLEGAKAAAGPVRTAPVALRTSPAVAAPRPETGPLSPIRSSPAVASERDTMSNPLAPSGAPLRGGASRGAVAVAGVLTLEAAPTDLDAAVVAEVRSALRGRTEPELADVLGVDPGRITTTLRGLAARGTLALRGTRWFTT